MKIQRRIDDHIDYEISCSESTTRGGCNLLCPVFLRGDCKLVSEAALDAMIVMELYCDEDVLSILDLYGFGDRLLKKFKISKL